MRMNCIPDNDIRTNGVIVFSIHFTKKHFIETIVGRLLGIERLENNGLAKDEAAPSFFCPRYYVSVAPLQSKASADSSS